MDMLADAAAKRPRKTPKQVRGARAAPKHATNDSRPLRVLSCLQEKPDPRNSYDPDALFMETFVRPAEMAFKAAKRCHEEAKTALDFQGEQRSRRRVNTTTP